MERFEDTLSFLVYTFTRKGLRIDINFFLTQTRFRMPMIDGGLPSTPPSSLLLFIRPSRPLAVSCQIASSMHFDNAIELKLCESANLNTHTTSTPLWRFFMSPRGQSSHSAFWNLKLTRCDRRVCSNPTKHSRLRTTSAHDKRLRHPATGSACVWMCVKVFWSQIDLKVRPNIYDDQSVADSTD